MQESTLLTEKELTSAQLRKQLDPQKLNFRSTDELKPLEFTIGQERALDAIERGLEIDASGFNIFACGETGTGRTTTIQTKVHDRAQNLSTPNDFVYVQNFRQSDQPTALSLPPGQGRQLAADMEDLIKQCREEIPKAFESEQHAKKKTDIMQRFRDEQTKMLNKLDQQAREYDHTVRKTNQGVIAVPLVNGNPVSEEKFNQLDNDTQNDLIEKGKQVQTLIAETMSQARRLEKQMREETQEEDRKLALYAVGYLVDDIKQKYSEQEDVVNYLEEVKEDIVENVDAFRDGEQQSNQMQQLLGIKDGKDQTLSRYRVNVVVDRTGLEGAPVIHERNPTYYNLFGQLEYKSQMGGMVTDFTMIKAGSFQAANGGYLILHVLDLLRNPFSWEALKRTIRTGQAKIENMGAQYQMIPAATLKPDPISVNVKVILIGSRMIYHLLHKWDEDFRRFFKIKADFDVEMDLTDEHLNKYASFIHSQCQKNNLQPFNSDAVTAIAEYSARLAEHQERLSSCFLSISDLIAESAQQSADNDKKTVDAEDVKQARQSFKQRSRLLQDKIQRLIDEGTLLIDTEESVTGQLNGLSITDLGDYRFGHPSRITCVTSVGRSGVVNIERESKMSGSVHDKGVLIMSGFLASRFGQDKPLALSASICFEQLYGGIDGDSASCAELYTLLSSLAAVPLRQDIAVTGSINQRGQVQPIGGVNEKIEGFYEVCRNKGLNGKQGVMIPRRNLHQLMLDDELIEAVNNDKFHVYAVDNVAEGIEILTGCKAGDPDDQGKFPEDTVFGKVDKRLAEMAAVMQNFGPFQKADNE